MYMYSIDIYILKRAVWQGGVLVTPCWRPVDKRMICFYCKLSYYMLDRPIKILSTLTLSGIESLTCNKIDVNKEQDRMISATIINIGLVDQVNYEHSWVNLKQTFSNTLKSI